MCYLIQHCEADQPGALIYADVFSSSMIHSKLQNQTPELYDDRVDYAEVNHNLRSATYTHNTDTNYSEVGKYIFIVFHSYKHSTQSMFKIQEDAA